MATKKKHTPHRDNKRSKNGGRFERGNQAARGKGRPKKDFDLETEAQVLSPPILRRFAAMGARGVFPHDVAAGRVVLAYAYGNPRERKEVSGPNGGPVPMAAVALTTEEARRELEAIEAAIGLTESEEPGEPEGDEPPAVE